jgi:hypothetical protein
MRRPDKIRVDIDDLEKGQTNIYTGGLYRNYQGKPFTGFMIDGYYENGEDIGWEIEFYDNGLVERESLNYCATTVYFNKFDKAGNKILGGFVADKELLYKVCDITGEDPDNVK